MEQQDDSREHSYPTGRGYGHDYLRGGELQGGYGYSARPDYQRRRGDRGDGGNEAHGDALNDERLDAQPDEARASDGRLTDSAQQRPRRQPSTSPNERPLNAP